MVKAIKELAPGRTIGKFFDRKDKCIVSSYHGEERTLVVAIKHHPLQGWTIHWEATYADRFLQEIGSSRTAVEQKFKVLAGKAEGNWE